MDRIRQLFNKHTAVRYLFVGGTSYVFELSALLVLYHLTGSKSLAAALSFLLGFLIAFALQKLVAFKEFSKDLQAISRQSALYILLNIWNYIFTIVFVSVWPAKYLVISRTVALVVMSCWNYVIYHKLIFKHKKSSPSIT